MQTKNMEEENSIIVSEWGNFIGVPIENNGFTITNGGFTTMTNWSINGSAYYETPAGSQVSVKKQGVHPTLVFKLWKKKLGVISNYKYSNRIDKVKALACKYLKLGHSALGEKFLAKISYEVRMSEIYASGVKMFLSKSLIDKYKYKVRDGHIADTQFNKYTGVIPDHILKVKNELEKRKVFDAFIIYHYWNEELEEKKEKKQPRTAEEKSAMRDPILFGVCADIPDKLFFIADWDDDYCDLTFDEMINQLPVEDKDVEVSSNPSKFDDK
jgi:hypothetical protein